MMKARADHLARIGLEATEVKGWSKNWSNLKAGAKRVGRICTLSFEEYTDLAVEAGLNTASQVGRYPGAYQMGRNRDEGNYVKGNCRFIVKEDNLKERWMYDKNKGVVNGG
jgi:hypothetical protein